MLPLLRLVTSEAHTLAEHATAYADLAAEEMAAMSRHWSRRAVAWAVAGVSALVAMVLVGVALMLWAVVPLRPDAPAWVLLAVPAAPAVMALLAVWFARRGPTGPAFTELRSQLRQDLAMLQESIER